MIIFKKPRSIINYTFKIKLNGIKLQPCKEIKYLGIYLDENLNGNFQSQLVLKKLVRSNGILAKARHYVNEQDLKAIYYSTFHCHLNYGCQIWLQYSKSNIKNVLTLQKKAMRIMSFSEFRASSMPLFSSFEVLKVEDFLDVKNLLFVHDFINGKLPIAMENMFTKQQESHTVHTRLASVEALWIPFVDSTGYGLNSTVSKSISVWNESLKTLPDPTVLSKSEFRDEVTKRYLNQYKI